MERYFYIYSILGYISGAHMQQLGFLHTSYHHANIHEESTAI